MLEYDKRIWIKFQIFREWFKAAVQEVHGLDFL